MAIDCLLDDEILGSIDSCTLGSYSDIDRHIHRYGNVHSRAVKAAVRQPQAINKAGGAGSKNSNAANKEIRWKGSLEVRRRRSGW